MLLVYYNGKVSVVSVEVFLFFFRFISECFV